jgi:hypothetical protein
LVESDAIKNLNVEIKEEVTENIDHKVTIDDFTHTTSSFSLWFKRRDKSKVILKTDQFSATSIY